ncbi:MAG: YciI family protein [Hyphomicrobiales bacterium]|nr:YciI family protein [Hyphomicrobiales bacterium]
MVIVKATKDAEAGVMPPPDLIERMGAFNKALMDAGLFVDGGGLKASANGARVSLGGENRVVTRGPFDEIGTLVSGFWLWKVNDLEEAIGWAKRCPTSPSGPFELEIRPLLEMEDFR